MGLGRTLFGSSLLNLCVIVSVASAVGCHRDALVGELTCTKSSDCRPPDTICGSDGRCVAGCVNDPNACIGGASCDRPSGECTGGTPCGDDTQCDPPAEVCLVAMGTCVAGCTVSPCASGSACNPATGHCCDPKGADCPGLPDGGPSCNTDSECVGAPANICSASACVPGCLGGVACSAPLTCNAATGHCEVPTCARDLDCDNGSYCTPAASCEVLAFGGPITCAGGTRINSPCFSDTTPAAFQSCIGAPGPTGCPYCTAGSCFHPGLCTSANDCHKGSACLNGLCRAVDPPCPVVVPVGAVYAGTYAAGKEICVRDVVFSAKTTSVGMNEIRLGNMPYLYMDLSPLEVAAGVRVPMPGETVTVHGVVRWDQGHYDRELLPVDWVSPP